MFFTTSLTGRSWYCFPPPQPNLLDFPENTMCVWMLLVHTEPWVGATCLNGGVSAMRVKVILQKWFNRAIAHICGRNAAPAINLNQFIAHRRLPLFYFKFRNQIKVKEAKDERRRGKEARGAERGQEGGSRTRNGLEQAAESSSHLGLEGWASEEQRGKRARLLGLEELGGLLWDSSPCLEQCIGAVSKYQIIPWLVPVNVLSL